jgi:hypothetical protein
MVEPMIVGPTTLLTCPMAGPTNERTAPQVVDTVPAVAPPTDVPSVEQPEVSAPAWTVLGPPLPG